MKRILLVLSVVLLWTHQNVWGQVGSGKYVVELSGSYGFMNTESTFKYFYPDMNSSRKNYSQLELRLGYQLNPQVVAGLSYSTVVPSSHRNIHEASVWSRYLLSSAEKHWKWFAQLDGGYRRYSYGFDRIVWDAAYYDPELGLVHLGGEPEINKQKGSGGYVGASLGAQVQLSNHVNLVVRYMYLGFDDCPRFFDGHRLGDGKMFADFGVNTLKLGVQVVW